MTISDDINREREFRKSYEDAMINKDYKRASAIKQLNIALHLLEMRSKQGEPEKIRSSNDEYRDLDTQSIERDRKKKPKKPKTKRCRCKK
jgi:hypothetical protein